MASVITTFKIDSQTLPDPVVIAQVRHGCPCPIGAAVASDQGIRINDACVSGFHAVVECDSTNNLTITDRGSTNGTLLLDDATGIWKKIAPHKPIPLSIWDRFIVGHTALEVRPETAAELKAIFDNAHQGRSIPSPRHVRKTVGYPSAVK